MHSDYVNRAIRELRDQQVRFASREKKLEQVDLAEQLLSELEPNRTYTCQYLCFRITKYQPESYPDMKVNGREASHDLRLFVEDLSDSANVPAYAAGEPVLTVHELSRRFQVSTKTIFRWRRQGLVSRRFVFDGRKRVGFLQSSIDRFVQRNPERIRRGARFSQLSDQERQRIINWARRMARAGGCPSDVTKRLARITGRSAETIRYTLKQFDQDHPNAAIFSAYEKPLREETKRTIYQQFRRGESVGALAKRFCRTRTSVYRIVGEMRARRIIDLPLDYIPNDQFPEIRSERQEKEVLDPAPPNDQPFRTPRLPSGLPPYLASLYEVPLLTRDQEVHSFRKMNYLKYKAGKLREKLDPSRPKTALMDQIDALYDQAVATKNEILSANLRLVVSIAKRCADSEQDFTALLYEARKRLDHAVDDFDFAGGRRFHRYAAVLIMQGLSRRAHPRGETILAEAGEHRGQHFRAPVTSLGEVQVPETWERLDDREKEIIAMRFGLFGEGRRTLKQIGEKLGVSKERVRQIETRALHKLGQGAMQTHFHPQRSASHVAEKATSDSASEPAGKMGATSEEAHRVSEHEPASVSGSDDSAANPSRNTDASSLSSYTWVAESIAPRPFWQMTRGEFHGYKQSKGERDVQRINREYREIIAQAVSEGRPVDPRVLAEYPDLRSLGGEYRVK